MVGTREDRVLPISFPHREKYLFLKFWPPLRFNHLPSKRRFKDRIEFFGRGTRPNVRNDACTHTSWPLSLRICSTRQPVRCRVNPDVTQPVYRRERGYRSRSNTCRFVGSLADPTVSSSVDTRPTHSSDPSPSKAHLAHIVTATLVRLLFSLLTRHGDSRAIALQLPGLDTDTSSDLLEAW